MILTAPPPLQRIVLTGFMGSGKTTVGRRLAGRLGWRFLDLDGAVEQAAGKSVPAIFAGEGEAAFRRAETEALALLLQRVHVVIALGGGAPGTAAVRELLLQASHTAIVFLHAPFDTLYGRCERQSLDPEATVRPLLGGRVPAGQRYTARQPFYEAIATLTIDVSSGTPESIAEALIASLLTSQL